MSTHLHRRLRWTVRKHRETWIRRFPRHRDDTCSYKRTQFTSAKTGSCLSLQLVGPHADANTNGPGSLSHTHTHRKLWSHDTVRLAAAHPHSLCCAWVGSSVNWMRLLCKKASSERRGLLCAYVCL